MEERPSLINKLASWLFGEDEEAQEIYDKRLEAWQYLNGDNSNSSEYKDSYAHDAMPGRVRLRGYVGGLVKRDYSGTPLSNVLEGVFEDETGTLPIKWFGTALDEDSFHPRVMYEVRGELRLGSNSLFYIHGPLVSSLDSSVDSPVQTKIIKPKNYQKRQGPARNEENVTRTSVYWDKDISGKKLSKNSKWNLTREKVLNRDKFRCVNCRSTFNLTVDHIKPLSLGGTNNLNNLQTLCKDCHEDKHYSKFLERGFDADDNYGENYKLNAKIKSVNEAIKSGIKLTINYTDREGNKTHRVIYPEDIYKGFETREGRIVNRKAIYVKAYCTLREDKRSFRLSRMKITSN